MKALRHRFSSGFFIVLSLVFLIFGRTDNGIVNSLRITITDASISILGIASRPMQAADDFITWTRQVAIVFSDNKRLREENSRLKFDQIKTSQLVIDNQRLKRLLNVGEGKVTTIAAARVVSDSASPFFKSVLINRGARDGVKERQAVINEEGIVGRTINVGESSARVLLATDLNSRIPVKLATSGINMILEGDNSVHPKLSFLPIGEKVAIGDLILTSGYGMVFPRDLPVGQIIDISPEGIKIKLSAQLYRLNYVSIVGYNVIHPSITGQRENQLKEKH